MGVIGFSGGSDDFDAGNSMSGAFRLWTSNLERMRIDNAGNVGIGKSDPAYKLDVNGTISGNNVIAKYQDVAEWVPASRAIPAGTVVVLNLDRNNEVMPSAHAYDPAVAGVVSTNPGVLLGVAGILVAVADWSALSFGVLDYSRMMRLVVPAVTLLAVGVQIAMAAFLSSILDLEISKA